MSTSPENPDRALLAWAKDRYPIAKFVEWAKHKTVPIGPGAFWYYFGSNRTLESFETDFPIR